MATRRGKWKAFWWTVALAVLVAFAAVIHAVTESENVIVVPPPAAVRLCGENTGGLVNGIWTRKERVRSVIAALEEQGCFRSNIVVINNDNGWYFIYGHRVLIGE